MLGGKTKVTQACPSLLLRMRKEEKVFPLRILFWLTELEEAHRKKTMKNVTVSGNVGIYNNQLFYDFFSLSIYVRLC